MNLPSQARIASRKRGREQQKRIVSEAQSILITEGYASLTLRRVAKNLSISLGNLTYYFPTKDALLEAMIADSIEEHARLLREQQANFPPDPKGRFLAYLDYLIAECRKRGVRSFFFQIWGMATHSETVRQLRDGLYRSFRAEATTLIEPLHESIGSQELDHRVGALIAFIEGLHVIFDFDSEVLNDNAAFESGLKDQAYRLAAL